MNKKIKAGVVTYCLAVIASLGMFACAAMNKVGGPSSASPEVIARDAITGSHAGLLSLEKAHPECGTLGATDAMGRNSWDSSHSKVAVCGVIDQAIGAVNLAIDATEAYCSIPTIDVDKCTPPAKGTPAQQQLVGKLQAAVGNLNQIMADVKAATGSQPAPPTVAPAVKPN